MNTVDGLVIRTIQVFVTEWLLTKALCALETILSLSSIIFFISNFIQFVQYRIFCIEINTNQVLEHYLTTIDGTVYLDCLFRRLS